MLATFPSRERILALEAAFQADVTTNRLWRFTPYLQTHEYEALLLVDIDAMGRCMPDEAATGVAALMADMAGLAPEDVDGGTLTAPSKRIVRHFPSYAGSEIFVGPLAAGDIGLRRPRAACPHFSTWIGELERRCRD